MSENNNSKDKKTEILSETEELINSSTPEDLKRIDKMKNLQKIHAEDKKKSREVINKLEDDLLVSGNEKERLEDENLQKTKEIDKLKAALLKQKNFLVMSDTERQMSESELVGKMALDIIDKRLAERYGK